LAAIMAGVDLEQEEVPLTGGRIARGVVRVGDTVRRPMPPDPDYVHRLLAHLERCGFEGAPRFLGVDSRGREIVSYIEGATVHHNGFRLNGEAVAAGARLVRRVHELTAGTEFAAGSEVACHLNLSQPNFVFRDTIPIAIIDWDVTRPGSRIANLADFLWAFVHPGVYDDNKAAEMLRVAVDAYGWTSGGLVDAMLTTVRTFVEINPEFRDWGVPELEHLERNAELFRKRLNA
jgi:Phosphotransferase enzyme family